MKHKIRDVIEDQLVLHPKDYTVAGIDIGSRASKGVLFHRDELYSVILPSNVSSVETAKKVLERLLKEADLKNEDVDFIVGTGYGRVAMEFDSIPFEGVTEITAHALGAHYLNKNTRTVIDIGGQDSKAVKLDPANGSVVDFIMNDKCAAGTGRFLEKVAQLLEIDLEELGEYSIHADAPEEISSQCVVFAESEVISLKANGASKENIAAGIHLATARRVKSLLRRVGFEDDVLFTGGVSRNRGMVKALEQEMQIKLAKPKLDTTFAGALGAAVLAGKKKEESYVA